MLSAWKRCFIIMALSASICIPLAAETASADSLLGTLALNIGVQQFTDPVLSSGLTNPVSYHSLGLSPDLDFGPFGVGMDLTINYRFQDGSPVIRQWDWWPQDPTVQSVAELWLSKFTYVRWGKKGEPLFVKLGQIDDGSLGNGFIMSGYANTCFVPDRILFGMSLDFDAALFNFPYVGFESFIGNLTQFDVIGGRLYVRPLMLLNIPILKDLQVGGTIVADTKPLLYTSTVATTGTGTAVAVYGGDLRLPIVGLPVFSLTAFGDMATIAGKSLGGMIGAGGKLFGIMSYGAQMRVMGETFIPSYFDATYDLYRDNRYETAVNGTGTGLIAGYYGSAGFSLLDEKIVFNASVSGPINPTSDTTNTNNYPHLKGVFLVKEGLLSGLSFTGSYDKQFITSWADLISAANAAIQAKLNYKTGPAVLSFVYKIVYDPTNTPAWEITSGLESSIQLF